MSIFDEGFSIPDPSESPVEGHEEETAEDLEDQDFDDQDHEDEYEDENPDETPEDEEGEDPDAGHSEQLLAGKYKTVDELVNGYQNLQREFTKSRQPQGQQQPPQTQQPPAGGQGDQSQTFWQHFEKDPLGTMQYLIDTAVNVKTAPIMEQRQTDTVAKNIEAVSKEYKQISSEEGMKQLFSKVNEIAQEMGNPALAQAPTQRILRMAAAEAFGESKQQVYDKAKNEGRQAAEIARQRKRNLEAPRGTNPKSKEQPLSEEDSIRQSILAAGRGGRGLLS